VKSQLTGLRLDGVALRESTSGLSPDHIVAEGGA
jgi:hypothetical protein